MPIRKAPILPESDYYNGNKTHLMRVGDKPTRDYVGIIRLTTDFKSTDPLCDMYKKGLLAGDALEDAVNNCNLSPEGV